MKKILVLLLVCLTVFSLSSCGTANCDLCGKEVEKGSDSLCEECVEKCEDLFD